MRKSQSSPLLHFPTTHRLSEGSRKKARQCLPAQQSQMKGMSLGFEFTMMTVLPQARQFDKAKEMPRAF